VRGAFIVVALCLVLLLSGEMVSSLTISVKKSCKSTTCTRNQASPCCANLKSAVAIVHSYESILVFPGNYSGVANTGICTGVSKTGIDMRNCTFSGVSLAGTQSTGVYISGTASDGLTRAIHVLSSSFSLIANLTFQDFRVSLSSHSSGGVISFENSTVTLSRITFLNNFAFIGGAFSMSFSNVHVEDSIFRRNQASVTGGAIFSAASNLTLLRSHFDHNNASSVDNELSASGGALAFIASEGMFLDIKACTFYKNEAQRSGGAVSIESQALTAGPSFIFFQRTTFDENTVSGLGSCASTSSCNSIGGAVYVNAANVSFEYCKFTKNSAESTSNSNVRPTSLWLCYVHWLCFRHVLSFIS
jgi:predicted outer membrane repeat protein